MPRGKRHLEQFGKSVSVELILRRCAYPAGSLFSVRTPGILVLIPVGAGVSCALVCTPTWRNCCLWGELPPLSLKNLIVSHLAITASTLPGEPEKSFPGTCRPKSWSLILKKIRNMKSRWSLLPAFWNSSVTTTSWPSAMKTRNS